jgi:hypothetical protein
MIRPKLPHPLGDRRHPRHRRRGGEPAGPQAQWTIATHAPPAAPSRVEAAPIPQEPHTLTAPLDLDVQRVQEAGGPIDHASYSCQCGYLFSADVSTTVSCPHCGTSQAW